MLSQNSTTAVGDFRAERDRFVVFAFAAADLLIEVGNDGRVTYAAGAARALTGHDTGALVGTPVFDIFSAAHRDFMRAFLQKVRREKRVMPVTLSLGSGKSELAVVINGCCLPEKKDKLYFTVALRPEPMKAEDVALRDEETGLLDLKAFQSAAIKAINSATENNGDVAMKLIDVAGIDDLRARSGDGVVTKLLGEIGTFLASHSVDGASAGRIAPDRFGVVQDRNAQSTDLGKEIERISKAHDHSGRGLVAKEQTVALAADKLSPADAEKALVYTLGRFAAEGGKALSVKSLTDGFRDLVNETVSRISHFRSSVEDRLSIVFQPVVDLTDAKTHHHEVLARFGDGRSPAEMIQFAEGVGMIEEFDLTVCQRALGFLDSARDNPQLKLAVNLSALSLRSDMFMSALEQLLQPRADRKRLLFEITETTEIADLARADRLIQEFRGGGHAVCLDDFGAGAASFPYLQALKVDFIKIDGGYVKRMLQAERDHTILKGMVRLCRDLGTATIAEMIETELQRQRLADIGVQYGQGYLFGRPTAMPMDGGKDASQSHVEAHKSLATRKVPPPSKVVVHRKGAAERWG